MILPGNWTNENILKLTLHKGLTYATQKKIIERFDSYTDLTENLPAELAGKINPARLFQDDLPVDSLLDEQLNFLEKYQIQYITYWDELYPANMKMVEQAPVILFYKGTLENNSMENISIVGTRKCSLYGRLTTEKFAAELVENNITIVSGLAYGVDSIAHQTAVKSGGITYAVVACGIDSIAPAYSEKLADEIIAHGGAIISEYKCEVKARPGYFPQRNRIISGLSKATIVIESDTKGGSLITARFAADQSREVFAVPGPVNSPKSAGCNKLIHDNLATVALSAKSVLVDLGLIEEINYAPKHQKLTFAKDSDKLLYEALSNEPRHIDELPEITNMEISEILVKLLEFEFKGLVRQLPGKHYITV